MNQVVVVGSLGYDQIMSLPQRFADFIDPQQLQRLNVSFTVQTLRKEFGGTGANCAYALAQFGVRPVLVSAWGADAQDYRAHLSSWVDLRCMREDQVLLTAVGHVMTDIDGNQIWMYYPGVLQECKKQSLTKIVQPDDLVVLMPNEPEAFVTHLKELIALKVDFIFDPSFFIPNLTSAQLSSGLGRAKYIFGNEYEITMMEQKTRSVRQEWVDGEKIVVETRGLKGSRIYTQAGVMVIPAVVVDQAADPTGAGDVYRAGFVAGLMRGESLETCGRMGSLAASYCVEQVGTQTYRFTSQEFFKRYAREFDTTI